MTVFRPFDDRCFGSSATFWPPASGVEVHGDPTLPAPTTAGTTLPCYGEPSPNGAARTEGQFSPTGVKLWSIFTQADPGVTGPDWLALWGGRNLRTLSRSTDQTDGAGLLWRTECQEVT